MIARCYSPKTKCYPQYGGRGITVCDEWRESFENFYKWVLENGYDPNVNGVYLSLDRIDNNKGYSPDNCRLVAPKVQQNNKRSNHLCEYKGGKYTLSQFAEKFNMDYAFVHRRIKQGYSTEQMIEEWELIVNKPDYYVHYCTYASQNNIPKERLRNMLIEGEIKGLKINSKWYVDTRDSNG